MVAVIADDVHAPAQVSIVPPRLHVVGKRGNLAGEGGTKIPDVDLVAVPPGQEGHPGRHANGVVAISVIENGGLSGKAIEVWRADQGMAVASGYCGVVLIRHDD